jgi:hypothetical protein
MLGPRSLPLTAVLIAALAFVSACRQAPLANARSSPDDLGRDLLAALAANDAGRMQALALSEEQFKDLVWPSLPASRPERNLPFSYVWGDLKQKSEASLARTLQEEGGKRYDLKAIKMAEKPRLYPGFRVHEEVRFVVVDRAGVERTLTLCGSLFERDGAWKIFSFVVDD